MPKEIPDLKTFLEDPRFEADRTLFKGLYKAFRAEEIEQEKREREEREKNENTSIFDKMFGGKD